MRPLGALLAFVTLAAGCAAPAGPPAPVTASDFKPAEIRQPALVVRLAFGPGEFGARERASLPGEYEGALLEALNQKAVLARDVRVQDERDGALDARGALARARELGADHAIVVDVRVARGVADLCRDSRRPFRAPATVWSQAVQVLRVRDGAARLTLGHGALRVLDVEPDCDNPRESRRRSPAETIAEAVDRLLGRVLGP